MTAKPELDTLIIENMADLDATAKRIDALTDEIWGEVSSHLVSWAKGHGWVASLDMEYSVGPPGWAEEKSAWFKVGWGPSDNGKHAEGEAYFDLSRFAGVGGGRFCLWLEFYGVNRSDWKPLFREAASQAKELGFSFDDADGFYIDCTPPPGSLAAVVADDNYAAAFAPLTRALDAAREHWRLFDQLLKKARA